MSGSYGQSSAAALMARGRYTEALEAAERAAALDESDPAAELDRAEALAALGHRERAVEALERALALDEEARELDGDILDDRYFTALLDLAEQRARQDLPAGLATLDRYVARFPRGSHAADVDTWRKRLRGEGKTVYVKERG